MTALAGEGQQVLMAAVFALHTGKAVVQVAALQIPVNDLIRISPPESGFATGRHRRRPNRSAVNLPEGNDSPVACFYSNLILAVLTTCFHRVISSAMNDPNSLEPK